HASSPSDVRSSCHENSPTCATPSCPGMGPADSNSANVAPWGSRSTANTPTAIGVGGTWTVAPSRTAWLVASSTSAVPMYGSQYGRAPIAFASSEIGSTPPIGAPFTVHMRYDGSCANGGTPQPGTPG